MRFAHLALAAALAVGHGAAGAAEWIEAQSLRELPAGIQVLLGVGLGPGDGGIADRGERIGTTGALHGMLPLRRFALGMVGAELALVAEERRGVAYSVHAVEYRRTGDTWEAARCAALFQPPQRAAELLDAFAGRGGRPVPCSRPDPAPGAPRQVQQFQTLRPRPGA